MNAHAPIRRKRPADLTPLSRRITPNEVARLWFRRGDEFAPEIHERYPDFPRPAPDGLYLVSAVESWFDRFHGRKAVALDDLGALEAEAMKVARGGQNPASR